MDLFRPKVYIETTIFNFVFNDHAPDMQNYTLQFFDKLRQGLYIPYTSEYVIQELSRTPQDKLREDMLSFITSYSIIRLPIDTEAERIAKIYIDKKIIPASKFTDAVHIASATINKLSFIVSYNYKHIVKASVAIMTSEVNIIEGYNRIGIYSPEEIITDAYESGT